MKAMNFPPKFIAWFLMLHKNATTRLILAKGKLSESIKLLISLRQGCPSSMPGYVIQFEPFLIKLDKKMMGITFGNLNNPLALKEKGEAFADDNENLSMDVNYMKTFE